MERNEIVIKTASHLRKCCMLANDVVISENSNLVFDFGIDSMGIIEFVMAIEAEFGISLVEDEIKTIKTFDSVICLIMNKLTK